MLTLVVSVGGLTFFGVCLVALVWVCAVPPRLPPGGGLVCRHDPDRICSCGCPRPELPRARARWRRQP